MYETQIFIKGVQDMNDCRMNGIDTGIEPVNCEADEGRFRRGLRAIRQTAGKIGTRNIVVVCSLMLIGAAVILNFVLFGDSKPTVTEGELLGAGADDPTPEAEQDTYFASAQLSRRQARDQAIAVLQTVVDSDSADAASKEQATSDINRIAAEMQTEANIETLIRSKGFEECVAVISEGVANVIVRSDGLLPNELSQIKEIVWEQAGIDPVNIKIIEKQTEA